MNPQTAVQAGPGLSPQPGFWRRQFEGSATFAQTVFDLIFGIAMPVLCFLLDPGIIRDWGLFPFIAVQLSRFSPFIYGLSALAIPTLGLWLVIGKRIRTFGGPISGVLLTGAICSFLIGVAILPLSVLFLVVAIGALGFTPLFTAFVYLRNSIRSFNRSLAHAPRRQVLRSLLLAFALAVAVPGLANWEAARMVTRSMDQIIEGDDASIERAAQRLKYVQWYARSDRIVFAYQDEANTIRKERLAKAYRVMTGEDIEDRLHRLRD